MPYRRSAARLGRQIGKVESRLDRLYNEPLTQLSRDPFGLRPPQPRIRSLEEELKELRAQRAYVASRALERQGKRAAKDDPSLLTALEVAAIGIPGAGLAARGGIRAAISAARRAQQQPGDTALRALRFLHHPKVRAAVGTAVRGQESGRYTLDEDYQREWEQRRRRLARKLGHKGPPTLAEYLDALRRNERIFERD